MQMFVIALSSCYIESFINMQCPSSSLVTFLNLQFMLSDINIAIRAPFWLLFA